MDAQKMKNLLMQLLAGGDEDVLGEDEDLLLSEVRTFKDAGVCTYNEGLVVNWDDDTEFQITIVQSE